MTLSQKEVSFLQDLKHQEQVCIDKYNRYSANACDNQLKTLFSQIGQKEQQHLDTINQILNGTVPTMGNDSNQNASSSGAMTPTYQKGTDNEAKQNDSFLCSDALAMEKYVSDIYNTSIFEFANSGIRDTLNHIQKEEQDHGKKIYDYMAANGMYQ